MQKFINWYLKFYPTSGTPLKRRIIIHISFWIIWGLFFVLSFIGPSRLIEKFYVTLFSFLQGSIIYYGIIYFAIPNLISSKRIVFGLLTLLIIYFLNYQVRFGLAIYVLNSEIYPSISNFFKYCQVLVKKGFFGFFSPPNLIFELYQIFHIVTIPFMLKFSRVITDYSLRVARLTKEKADLEIAFLRTQLNPHFLLNSLNNIYSQVVSKDETAGDSIVSLSDSMKYILYNSGEPWVDLESEVRFLRNYVDLQKLKGDSYLKIRFTQEGNMEGFKIAPLILINYLENAFKHAGKANEETYVIAIEIKFENEVLHFNIENDCIDKSKVDSKNKGVGIINTKRRLELIYADKHGLEIKNENNIFKVDLWIKLKKE